MLLDLFVDADQENRDNAKQIIKASERDQIEIALPAIVVAELAGAPNVRGDDVPAQTRHERVLKVREWLLSTRFAIIEIDERIARRASELCEPFQLKGADACILAATELWQIPDLYTRDRSLLKIGKQLTGVHVREPLSFPIADQRELDVDGSEEGI